MPSISARTNATLSLLIVAALPAAAAEGRIPLWDRTTITMPGHYVVTRDIVSAAAPILDIRAENVTVDLNGHTLMTGDMTMPAIRVAPPSSSGTGFFVLRSGKILGGMCGLHVIPPDMLDVRLSDLRIAGAAENAVEASRFARLQAEAIIIIDTKGGFVLENAPPNPCLPPDPCRSSASITESSIHADVGIRCVGTACRVTNSSITSCRAAVELQDAADSQVGGSDLNAPGSEFCFNPQPEPPGDIIQVIGSDGVAVRDNTIHGDGMTATSEGIFADGTSDGVSIAGNVVTGVGGDGIHVLGMNGSVMGNVVHGAGDDGIAIGGSNSLVDGNKVGGNAGFGLEFLTGNHAYRANMLRGNMAGAVGGAGASDATDAGGNIP